MTYSGHFSMQDCKRYKTHVQQVMFMIRSSLLEFQKTFPLCVMLLVGSCRLHCRGMEKPASSNHN